MPVLLLVNAGDYRHRVAESSLCVAEFHLLSHHYWANICKHSYRPIHHFDGPRPRFVPGTGPSFGVKDFLLRM